MNARLTQQNIKCWLLLLLSEKRSNVHATKWKWENMVVLYLPYVAFAFISVELIGWCVIPFSTVSPSFCLSVYFFIHSIDNFSFNFLLRKAVSLHCTEHSTILSQLNIRPNRIAYVICNFTHCVTGWGRERDGKGEEKVCV